jgi:Ca2+-binding RTX toxin-like protein
MDGGAGNDSLSFYDGTVVTGCAGADELYLRSDCGPDTIGRTPAMITDFDPAADTLAISAIDADDGAAWSVVAWADGLGADVLLGNTVVAAVTGGQALKVADLVTTA